MIHPNGYRDPETFDGLREAARAAFADRTHTNVLVQGDEYYVQEVSETEGVTFRLRLSYRTHRITADEIHGRC